MEPDGIRQAPRVTLLDGSHQPGELQFLSFEQKVVGLSVAGQGIKRVPFSSIAFYRFSAEQGIAESVMPIAWRTGLPPARPSSPFRGKLSNGKVFSGKMRAYLRHASGAFLVIPSNQKNGADSYIFIPEENIAELTVEESIGAMLVKTGTLSEQQVNAGLKLQKTLRTKVLGGYLKDVASVTQLNKALTHQSANPAIRRIGEVLVGENIISEAQLKVALGEQSFDRKKPLGQILIEQGCLTEEDLNRVMAQRLGIPEVSIKRFPVDPKAIRALPTEFAREKRVVPLCFNAGGALAVAMENPLDHGLVKEIGIVSQCKVDPVLASREEISQGLELYFGDIYASANELQSELADSAAVPTTEDAAGEVVTEADGALVRVLNRIISEGYRQKASDIHIEPRANGTCNVRFRKDGELEHYMDVPAGYRNALASRLKIMANLDISEKRKPQDGRIDFSKFSNLKFSLRLATIPTNDGAESITMRILNQSTPVALPKLGLEPDLLASLENLMRLPHGLVLVSGPTGSGKTTTLHSILQSLNIPERKIWTAEDPIEVVQDGLNQVQINTKVDLSFANALRSFLRADPDVIMVGEMRDAETASIAVSASLTGHLVLSTVHTNSSCETVSRLIDMGLDPFSFADALKGVVAQRLVRGLHSCKVAHHPEPEEMQVLAREYLGNASEVDVGRLMAKWFEAYAGPDGRFTLYREAGCEECSGKGFKGRVGIHEILAITTPIQRLIQTRSPLGTIFEQAVRSGLRTLKQDGILKVLQGKTTIAQVRAACA